MTPGDIGLVINTHLHFDHCGQNAVFKHAAFYVQAAELARGRRESPRLADWFDFMDARFELLNGDAEILPGLSVVATPGHTAGSGHRSGRVARVGRPGARAAARPGALLPRHRGGPFLVRTRPGPARFESSATELVLG
jgi:N-acyl homoserine lactone hydrolase